MVNLKIVNKVPCFVNGVLILGIDNNPSLGLYGWALIIILSSSRQANSVGQKSWAKLRVSLGPPNYFMYLGASQLSSDRYCRGKEGPGMLNCSAQSVHFPWT